MMVMIGGAGVVGGAIAGGFILGMMESVGLTVLHAYGDITYLVIFAALMVFLSHPPERADGQALGLRPWPCDRDRGTGRIDARSERLAALFVLAARSWACRADRGDRTQRSLLHPDVGGAARHRQPAASGSHSTSAASISARRPTRLLGGYVSAILVSRTGASTSG